MLKQLDGSLSVSIAFDSWLGQMEAIVYLFAKNPLVLPEIELEVLQLSSLYHNAGPQATHYEAYTKQVNSVGMRDFKVFLFQPYRFNNYSGDYCA